LLKAQTLKVSQLAFFNPIFQGKIYIDASDIGIKGIYIHINKKGKERPVMLISRKMIST